MAVCGKLSEAFSLAMPEQRTWIAPLQCLEGQEEKRQWYPVTVGRHLLGTRPALLGRIACLLRAWHCSETITRSVRISGPGNRCRGKWKLYSAATVFTHGCFAPYAGGPPLGCSHGQQDSSVLLSVIDMEDFFV